MNEIIVIDNVLPNLLFEKLTDIILDEKKFPWFYTSSTAYEEKETDNLDYSFSHVTTSEDGDISEMAGLTRLCIDFMLDKAGIKLKELYRARYGLLTSVGQNKIHEPHVDLTFTHTTGLFYLTETEGDTIIYNSFYDFKSDMTPSEYWDFKYGRTAKKCDSITPKANRLVLLPGKIYHSSSSTVNTDKRIVLNFNFK